MMEDLLLDLDVSVCLFCFALGAFRFGDFRFGFGRRDRLASGLKKRGPFHFYDRWLGTLRFGCSFASCCTNENKSSYHREQHHAEPDPFTSRHGLSVAAGTRSAALS